MEKEIKRANFSGNMAVAIRLRNCVQNMENKESAYRSWIWISLLTSPSAIGYLLWDNSLTIFPPQMDLRRNEVFAALPDFDELRADPVAEAEIVNSTVTGPMCVKRALHIVDMTMRLVPHGPNKKYSKRREARICSTQRNHRFIIGAMNIFCSLVL
jgi:hypothetical protein